MKRNLLLTAGLTAAVAISAFGIAQAAGNGNGGTSGAGGTGSAAMIQMKTQDRERAEYDYRYMYQYQTGDDEGSEYGDQLRLRDMTRTRTEGTAFGEGTEGYQARNMETEQYQYQVRVTDSSGNPLELKLAPMSDEVVEQELD